MIEFVVTPPTCGTDVPWFSATRPLTPGVDGHPRRRRDAQTAQRRGRENCGPAGTGDRRACADYDVDRTGSVGPDARAAPGYIAVIDDVGRSGRGIRIDADAAGSADTAGADKGDIGSCVVVMLTALTLLPVSTIDEVWLK